MTKKRRNRLLGAALIVGTTAAAGLASQPDETDEVDPGTTAVGAAEARAVAEAAHPGASVLAVEFDVKGGVALFEVEFDDGMDVKVDADTGVVILTEVRDAEAQDTD